MKEFSFLSPGTLNKYIFPVTDLSILYTRFYASAKRELRKQGCRDDAFDDHYQETFSILLEKGPGFLSHIQHPHSYIVRICMHLWQRDQKENSKLLSIAEMDEFPAKESQPGPDLMTLLTSHMDRISAGCREILNLVVRGCSEEEISNILGLTDSKAAKNKKYYCKEKLFNSIINDPIYQEIYG